MSTQSGPLGAAKPSLAAGPAAQSETALPPGAELLRVLESPSASLFDVISLLVTTADSVGLQFRLCQRLLKFPMDQIGFFLPELVHVFVTVETEAAALEDTLLHLSQLSTHFVLVIFWFLQAAITDLKNEPHSYGFASAKRLCNKLQYVLFASGELPADTQMHENPQPALVLASMVAAFLVPGVGHHMKPLVESQGRKQRSSYLIRRAMSKLRGHNAPPPERSAEDDQNSRHHATHLPEVNLAQLGLVQMGSQPNLTFQHPNDSLESLSIVSQTRSMPNLAKNAGESPHTVLRSNYFRCETQFVYALIAISQRLLQVPKEARQSALHVELALLNEDLPNAEVDLPMLLPRRHGKQNRIVRICVSEATVLNSAEKAPFLLLIEYLRGDLTFDPTKPRNREILRSDPKLRTHIFERPAFRTPKPVKAEPRPRSTTAQDLELDISEVSLLEREDMMQPDVAHGSSSANSLHPHEQQHSAGGHHDRRLHSHSHHRSPSANMPMVEMELNAAAQVQETRQYNSGPSAADLATQWRTATLILNQLDGAKLPKGDVATIRERIVASMQAMQADASELKGEAGERRLENDLKTAGITTREDYDEDDPSAANLGEDWQARRARIRRTSKFGDNPNWDLVSVIVKTGDDLRQEALASQLIQRAAHVWKDHEIGVWVRRMQILITSANSGLVETITNALSLHSIKKALTTAQVNEGGDSRSIAQLRQHFELKFGPPHGHRHQRAVRNFIQSLAAYSVLCYVLQIKDRHNGNILVDAEGHIIHIDFGFMLSNAPGHYGFEANTFKLTQEYVDLMGGAASEGWYEFVSLVTSAFLALRKHKDEFVSFVQIMGTHSTLPCFSAGPANTALQLHARFMPDLSEEGAKAAFEKLVWKSYGNMYTRIYDQYQLVTQGIYS